MSDLRRALDPQSIAIAGLSADPIKHGARVLENLRRHGFDGEVYGVNPGLPDIQGVPMHPSVEDLPAPVDLVVAAVPAGAAVDVVRSASGVGGVIVFGAGFAESGVAGTRLQDQLVAAASEAGTRVIGPNSGGVIRPGRGLTASFLTCLDRPPDQLRSGSVALVTQSGGTGSYLHNLAAGRGEGIAISVSTGNEADVMLGEAVDAVAMIDDVDVIVVLLETIRDGAAFIGSVERAHSRGQRVVACRLGTSDRASRLMTTHTGAMAVPEKILAGVFTGLGVVEVETPAEAYDVAAMLVGRQSAAGRRAGIVTHSGGAAILLSDLAERAGVNLPGLSPHLAERMGEFLDHGATSNPVDMGGIIGGPHRFAEAVATMAGSGEYDSILAVSTAHPPAHTAGRVDSLLSLETDVTVLHLWMAGDLGEGGLIRLRQAGIPVTEEPRAAIRALAGLLLTPDPRPGVEQVDEGPSFDWGLPLDPGIPAVTSAEAVAVASDIGYPVVVKADAPGLDHKTEIGGVALDVRSSSEVEEAFDRVTGSAERSGWQVEGVRLQKFRPGVELIVGAFRDESFGPLVSVGAGGVLTELMDDVVFRPGPVGIDQAREMIDSLSIRALLDGYRGSPAADVGELSRIVSVISHGVAGSGQVSEVELNPLIWDGSGWVAVDWLLVSRS
jgi:acyl-CoA synthetase (NDP forming)